MEKRKYLVISGILFSLPLLLPVLFNSGSPTEIILRIDDNTCDLYEAPEYFSLKNFTFTGVRPSL